VLRETSATSVLVECGFLSNPDDEKLLQDPVHQQKLADGIVKGITEYLKYVQWDG
jgi:N-acetylmuramoyl-L-alanine amidase